MLERWFPRARNNRQSLKEPMKKLRAFIAIPIIGEPCRRVTQWMQSVQPAAPAVRWMAEEGLHVTLKFFGEIDEREMVEIARGLQRVAADHGAFEMRLEGLGAFPSIDRPRTVWIGIGGGTEPLCALHDDLDRAFRESGYSFERRRYHPHLTIGRLRDKSGIGELPDLLAANAEIELGTAAADEVVLVAWLRHRDGATYTPLASCRLA